MRNNNENSPNESNQLYRQVLIDHDDLLFPMPRFDEEEDAQSIPRVLLLPRLDHSEMPELESPSSSTTTTFEGRIHGPISTLSGDHHNYNNRSRLAQRHSSGRSPLRDITIDRRW